MNRAKTNFSSAEPGDSWDALASTPAKEFAEGAVPATVCSPDAYRGIMRTLASSVVVIATDHGDHIRAMTATAFTPVSADPALVLFCIHLSSDTHNSLSVGSCVGISFLSEAQSQVSQRFAKKKTLDTTVSEAFSRSPDGTPIIAGACAVLSAKVAAQHWGGDHSIFVATVSWGEPQEPLLPLVYHNGSYVRLRPTETP